MYPQQFLKYFEDFGVLVSHKGRLNSTGLGHKIFLKLLFLKKIIGQVHNNVVVVQVVFDREKSILDPQSFLGSTQDHIIKLWIHF